MSIYDTRTDRADQPLSETEIRALHRLLSDPFSLPPEFWTALKTKFEQDPPVLTWDSIVGFGIAANRAIPVVPVLDIAVDISTANTDLPSPGVNWNNIWQVNPGGGSLRSIASGPTLEGTRITLKHGSAGATTLKHNNIGGTGRPLFLNGYADVVLTGSESIDLILLDTMWQDVARVETPVVSWPTMQKGVFSSPTLANNTVYTGSVTFPTAYVAAPAVTVQPKDHFATALDASDVATVWVTSVSATEFFWTLVNGARNGGTYDFAWMAVGT